MISPVHNYIEAYAEAGADIITIHPEATDDLNSSILKVKKLKKKVGISLNPETKTNVIYDFLDKIDLGITIGLLNFLIFLISDSKVSGLHATYKSISFLFIQEEEFSAITRGLYFFM